MIELQNVQKSFRVSPGPGRKAGTVEAVRGITARLDAGSIIGVVGPNGAGKTTLFGLLLGFLEPTQGRIDINGTEPRAYVRTHGATYLPERFQLPRDWTIRAGLHALLRLDGSATSVDELLERYQLTRYATARAHTLSRGTMQRVGMAQAFATPRDLVVLDEPTEGLDPIWRVRLREDVRTLRADGRTILLASHDLAEVERVADQVLVLRGGTITETVDLRAQHETSRDYVIVLTAPHDAVNNLFQNARRTSDATYAVNVQNAADLSARLGALVEAGGTVISVNPAADLEQRVTGTQERG